MPTMSPFELVNFTGVITVIVIFFDRSKIPEYPVFEHFDRFHPPLFLIPKGNLNKSKNKNYNGKYECFWTKTVLLSTSADSF